MIKDNLLKKYKKIFFKLKLNFKKIQEFIKNSKTKGIDTGLSSLCYFSSSEMSLGHHFFIKKFLNFNYIFKYLFFFLNSFFQFIMLIIFLYQRENTFTKKNLYYLGLKKILTQEEILKTSTLE